MTADEAVGQRRILVTGGAGFIGFHLAARLVAEGHEVAVVDNLVDYYDPALKRARLEELSRLGDVTVHLVDLCDQPTLAGIFDDLAPTHVVNLAAQAGVRYSIENPAAYIATNVTGFGHVLELCRKHQVGHLLYASSSSVYGETSKTPFSVHDPADHPVSVYAATKRADELLAHAYSHLFDLATTGLRFFTVYGPWGRPDMAYYIFADAIAKGEPIEIFGDGSALRSFTYIDDVVEALVRLLDRRPVPNPAWTAEHPDPASSNAPFRIFNVGHRHQIKLSAMIDVLEAELGIPARRVFQDSKPGDVTQTHADVSDLEAAVDFAPSVDLDEGLASFVQWFRTYHG